MLYALVTPASETVSYITAVWIIPTNISDTKNLDSHFETTDSWGLGLRLLLRSVGLALWLGSGLVLDAHRRK